MHPRQLLFLVAVTMLFVALTPGARAADAPHGVHYKWLAKNPTLPKTLVVLPVNIEVVEVSAGGVEEKVPDWSTEASQSVLKALSAVVQKQGLKEAAAPQLAEKFAANVDEHVALYKLVVNTVWRLSWKHKIKRFDYSIGPGLRELADKTGADAAVLVYGREYVSTAGRKARAVVGHIPLINAFTGPAPQLGHSFVHIGVVDLRTGDLLWVNSEFRKGSTNLRDPDDAANMVKTIFKVYPGIEKYRSSYID